MCAVCHRSNLETMCADLWQWQVRNQLASVVLVWAGGVDDGCCCRAQIPMATRVNVKRTLDTSAIGRLIHRLNRRLQSVKPFKMVKGIDPADVHSIFAKVCRRHLVRNIPSDTATYAYSAVQ
jgi:hypothetical protein